ncbi:hypothetical protein O6H91_23G060300 [Diphasiastrum complanatum]|uniref:Uncharacterized protein n=1 Tax=Diphasiastrum complanatum TaxID=34168 RepID=A0ACC2ABC3_DIPCM|nr:hypothetical protein O6H91_23G060300 [Diphasiastrum complanatum]
MFFKSRRMTIYKYYNSSSSGGFWAVEFCCWPLFLCSVVVFLLIVGVAFSGGRSMVFFLSLLVCFGHSSLSLASDKVLYVFFLLFHYSGLLAFCFVAFLESSPLHLCFVTLGYI